MSTYVALAFVVATASACASLRVIPAEQTDLCIIASDPEKFDGKIVRVIAIAAPEAHYNIFLYSNNCPRTAFIGGANSTVEGTANYETLSKILWVGYPAQKRSATVELVATFSWRKDEVPARVLWLKEVVSVQAIPRQRELD